MNLSDPKYDQPCMSVQCAFYLGQLIVEHNIEDMVEYGSGGSTLMFAKHVQKLYSYEHDKEFYNRLKDKVPSNVKLHNHSGATVIWDIEDFIDFAFIDGTNRLRCIDNCCNTIKLIAIHDSERKEYIPGYTQLLENGYKDISPEGINIKVFHNANLNN